MGKRELLLIVIFVAIGAVTYQLTAPPPKDGQGFSFSRLWGNTRRELQGNQPIGSSTQTGTIALGPGVTELRVTGVSRGMQILGEDRRDIGYELRVESSGSDPATAQQLAAKAVLKQDNLGPALALSVTYPREASQWASLTLHVPSRLAVHLESGTGARAANLASLELDRVGGITTAEAIAGGVTGVLNAGSELTVGGAGTVNLTIVSSHARLSKISRGVTLNTRAGRCEISDSLGPVAIDSTNTEISIANHAGTIRTSGVGGRVTIDYPQQAVEVNVRNAPISLTLGAAVPVSVFGAGERVRVMFDREPAITLDAVATGGRVDAADFGLAPEPASPDQEQRLTHAFGAAGAPRVTLRNSRGDIVIGKRK